MAERAVVDFQGGIRRWTSKGDNIRGTSAAKWLKRDKIIEIRQLGSSKDFISKRKYLIVYSFFNVLFCHRRANAVEQSE